MVRLDTLNSFQWRIRNMIWPAANYTVELDETQSLIVIKTANKKYVTGIIFFFNFFSILCENEIPELNAIKKLIIHIV